MSDRPEFPEMKARFGVAVEKAREMTAVERLQAAIAKFEELRGWVDAPVTVHEGPEWFELRDESGVQVAPYMSGFAAELFAALHRTIDAQLAILRDDYDVCKGNDWIPARYVLMLADAILGADS